VADHDTFGMRAMFRQAAGEQPGGGGRNHHICRQSGIKARQQGLLHLQALRRAFLHEIHPGNGRHRVCFKAPGIGLGIRLAAKVHQDRPGGLHHPAD